jgi:hypothetical protein
VIRINTIHHNKLLPSSLDRYHRHRKCYHRHRGMLSSSSGNAVIVIGEYCHRHREMLSSSSGNAVIVIGKCCHRHRGMLSSLIEARSSFRGLLSSSIEVILSRSQTYQCRFHDSDITVPTIAISSSRRLFVFLHNTIYYQ